MQSLKLHYKNNLYQSLRITRNQTFFFRKLRSRKRGNSLSVFHRIILNAATIREANCTVRITELRTISFDSIYSHLPSKLKVNGGKLAKTNRPWKCKKGKGRRSPLAHSRKLAEHYNFTCAVSRRYRDHGQR